MRYATTGLPLPAVFPNLRWVTPDLPSPQSLPLLTGSGRNGERPRALMRGEKARPPARLQATENELLFRIALTLPPSDPARLQPHKNLPLAFSYPYLSEHEKLPSFKVEWGDEEAGPRCAFSEGDLAVLREIK
eukprot:3817534-Rhodomonas_salina.1